jgi:hypothetical protein
MPLNFPVTGVCGIAAGWQVLVRLLRCRKTEQGALHDPGQVDGLRGREIGASLAVMGATIVSGVFF